MTFGYPNMRYEIDTLLAPLTTRVFVNAVVNKRLVLHGIRYGHGAPSRDCNARDARFLQEKWAFLPYP